MLERLEDGAVLRQNRKADAFAFEITLDKVTPRLLDRVQNLPELGIGLDNKNLAPGIEPVGPIGPPSPDHQRQAEARNKILCAVVRLEPRAGCRRNTQFDAHLMGAFFVEQQVHARGIRNRDAIVGEILSMDVEGQNRTVVAARHDEDRSSDAEGGRAPPDAMQPDCPNSAAGVGALILLVETVVSIGQWMAFLILVRRTDTARPQAIASGSERNLICQKGMAVQNSGSAYQQHSIAAAEVAGDGAEAGRILLRVFEVLDRAGIPYCVLHGYENYPAHIESDVDCIVDRSATPRNLVTPASQPRNDRG